MLMPQVGSRCRPSPGFSLSVRPCAGAAVILPPPPTPPGQRLSLGRRQGWARRTGPAGVAEPAGRPGRGCESAAWLGKPSGASLPAGSPGDAGFQAGPVPPTLKGWLGGSSGLRFCGQSSRTPNQGGLQSPCCPTSVHRRSLSRPSLPPDPRAGRPPGVPGLGQKLCPPHCAPTGQLCPAGLGLVLSGALGQSAARVGWTAFGHGGPRQGGQCRQGYRSWPWGLGLESWEPGQDGVGVPAQGRAGLVLHTAGGLAGASHLPQFSPVSLPVWPRRACGP